MSVTTSEAPALSSVDSLTQLMNAASASADPTPEATASATEGGGVPSQETEASPSADGQASPDAGREADADGTDATAGTAGTEAAPDKPLTQSEVNKLLEQVEQRVEARWRARSNQARDSEVNQLRAQLRDAQRNADVAILTNARAAEKARTEGLNYFDMQDVARTAQEEVQNFYARQDADAQRGVQQQQAAVEATRAEFEGRLAQAEKGRAALHVRLANEIVRNRVDVADLNALIDAPEVVNDKKIQRYIKTFSDPKVNRETAERALDDMHERAEELVSLSIKKMAIERAKQTLPDPQRYDRTQAHGGASSVTSPLPALGTGRDYLGGAMEQARTRIK